MAFVSYSITLGSLVRLFFYDAFIEGDNTNRKIPECIKYEMVSILLCCSLQMFLKVIKLVLKHVKVWIEINDVIV